jgi:hypothetical protein
MKHFLDQMRILTALTVNAMSAGDMKIDIDNDDRTNRGEQNRHTTNEKKSNKNSPLHILNVGHPTLVQQQH